MRTRKFIVVVVMSEVTKQAPESCPPEERWMMDIVKIVSSKLDY